MLEKTCATTERNVRSQVFLNLKENENCIFSSTDESVGAKAPIVRDTKVAKGVVHHNHTIHNFYNVGCSEMLICVSDRLFL